MNFWYGMFGNNAEQDNLVEEKTEKHKETEQYKKAEEEIKLCLDFLLRYFQSNRDRSMFQCYKVGQDAWFFIKVQDNYKLEINGSSVRLAKGQITLLDTSCYAEQVEKLKEIAKEICEEDLRFRDRELEKQRLAHIEELKRKMES